MNTRIGKGFDIHRLEAGLPLVLGGVSIPSDTGCIAHSDGDVLIHAIIDSLLGAAGKGDIGTLFPDTDPSFKGASGKKLIQLTFPQLPPFSIINLDMNIFCEKPKLAPFRDEIISNLSSLLSTDSKRISLKAKTMEQTGPIGRGEAIAAEALVLIELKGE